MPQSITELLNRAAGGDQKAFDHLLQVVYPELHRIADAYMRREPPYHTLQPTALIHEAYLRLAGRGAVYRNRTHFYAVAARIMRQILVDHARARHALKRGGAIHFSLNEGLDVAPASDRTVVALDDALKALAKEDETKARLVEMRFFGGMTAEEIADHEAIPVHTVRRQLRVAQAWLRREVES